jgi:hypothetical protein
MALSSCPQSKLCKDQRLSLFALSHTHSQQAGLEMPEIKEVLATA